MNVVDMSLCAQGFLFFLDRYLGVDLLDGMVSLCFTFWETSKLFFKVAAPFYILTSNEQKVPVSPSPHLHFFLFFCVRTTSLWF